MYASLGFETLTAPQAAVWLGALLGLAFGAAAAVSRFCLRRGLVAGPERRAALAVWAVGLAVAVLGTQAAVAAGLVDFGAHRFHAADLPVLAVLLGGALFGAGMVLTRGCPSRLLVLGAGGNLRALAVILVFALVAHATLKGVFAPARVALGGVTVPLGDVAALGALPGGSLVWAALIAAGALALARRAGARPRDLALGALIGALVPAGWAGTGHVLVDDFDPVALESLSFTAPAADSLFFVIASTAVPANFGVGLLAGTLAGALIVALVRRDARWESFDSPRQTGRYALGAGLMGVGGVLAGGCTVGAGLSGVASLSVSAVLALAAIAASARATDALLTRGGAGSAAPEATRRALPAE
jgi:uncharacterized membrane protein YedE/YeeE